MIDGLRHLLFPEACILCRKQLDREHPFICGTCLAGFEPFSGRDAGGEMLRRTVEAHFGRGFRPNEAWSLYPYRSDSGLHDAIHELKYGGLHPLGLLFGRKLGERIALSERTALFDGIVPVPLHRLKRIERSYNQADMVAGGISGVLGVPVLEGVVERLRSTLSQTGLGLKERMSNMEDAFGPGSKSCPADLLLVDDVLTTGATMVAVASVLYAAGARSVAFATVAVTEKK